MNCYYCNRETIQIEATGTCVVCLNHACSRPSGRPDGRFHGERCRYTGCDKFVCEFDVHDHAGPAVVKPSGMPTCFPYLTVGISMDALAASELTFGHRKKESLDRNSNRALTRAANFLTPHWRNSKEVLDGRVVETFLTGVAHPGRVPKEMRPEYLDPVRVARLCFIAAAALSEGWKELQRENETVFRRREAQERALGASDRLRPESLDNKVSAFVKGGGGEDPAAWEPDQFAVLSPRLAGFLQEVRSEFSTAFGQLSEFTFGIRTNFNEFYPSDELRKLPPRLGGWTVA